MDHTGFIVAAYAVTAVTLAAMVLSIVIDHRRLSARLRRLSARTRPGTMEEQEP